MKILLDINVILDVLADRQPHAGDSSAVLSLVESRTVQGVIAAHTATTLHYLLRRALGTDQATRALGDILRIVGVVPVDEDRLLHALAMGWSDFEDAVQAACAEKAEVDYLVTRNEDDFRRSSARAISPAAFRARFPPGKDSES